MLAAWIATAALHLPLWLGCWAALHRNRVDRAVSGVEAEAKDGRIPAEALKRIREEVYGVVG